MYIVHRTPEMLSTWLATTASCADPESKDSEQPDYARNGTRRAQARDLVLEGTCTHLGCLPEARFEAGDAELGADWPGGFFCPCHGSRFDLAGRVFNGSPASKNLRDSGLLLPRRRDAGDRRRATGAARGMAGNDDTLPVRTGFLGWR